MAAEHGTEHKQEHRRFHRRVAHHLKRHVYHDRYFAYAVAALVVAGLALASYVVIVGNRFSTDASFAGAAQANKIYINSEQGYSVSYPRTWVLENGDSGSIVTFEDSVYGYDDIAVNELRSGDEVKILSAISIDSEKDFTTANGVSVKLVQGNLGSNAPGEAAFLTKDQKIFYVSTTASPYFETFVRNFKITP